MIALDYGLDVVKLDDPAQCLIMFVLNRWMIRYLSSSNDLLVGNLSRVLHGDKV